MKAPKASTILAAVFWALTAVCFVIIFYFSSCNADNSAQQSASILDLLYKLFGENRATDFIVRKCAHFLEYTGTSLIMSAALYFTYNKNRIHLPIIFTSLYAVTDEIHQIFVEGRSCELRDWAIDTLGAVLGAVMFWAILYIISAIKSFASRRKDK